MKRYLSSMVMVVATMLGVTPLIVLLLTAAPLAWIKSS
jgi:hypothetical protein